MFYFVLKNWDEIAITLHSWTLRSKISSAAALSMGKRTDLQPPPRSLIEYDDNFTPHFHKPSPFVSVCGIICSRHHRLCPLLTIHPQMSLTLEEKQRLAKEQEQAAKLRSQQPLAPQAVKPASNSNTKVTLQHVWKQKHTHKNTHPHGTCPKSFGPIMTGKELIESGR